jgi:lycopene beta-cyclase
MHYDFIVTGTGCAGFSLIYELLKSNLKTKKILIIDLDDKKSNDKTWCYWGKEALEIHPKEELVSWNKIRVGTHNNSTTHSLNDIQYFHLKSIDFYKKMKELIAAHPNVSFLNDKVLTIKEINNELVEITTKNNGTFSAGKVFNSILDLKTSIPQNCIRQIFVGWTVETDSNVFENECATLMEFDVNNQNHVNFIYILPFSPTKALIEYTVFSDQNVKVENLENHLTDYLKNQLKIEHFKIIDKETGAIPMTNHLRASTNTANLIHIGTAGGCTKASTGFTFFNIQKQVQQLIKMLEIDEKISLSTSTPLKSKRFVFYDNIILNIIQKWPNEASRIFTSMFAKNNAALILKFLNEETSLWEEFNILRKLPLWVCLKSLMSYERY